MSMLQKCMFKTQSIMLRLVCNNCNASFVDDTYKCIQNQSEKRKLCSH